MRVLICAMLSLWAGIASAADQPGTVLEPASQWVVDYADNNCRLIRTFGSDKHVIKLIFEQVAPRSLMTVMLVGDLHARDSNNLLGFAPLADVQISGGQSLVAVGSRDGVAFWPRRLGRGNWGLIPETLATRMWKDNPGAAATSLSAPWDRNAPKVKWIDHNWHVAEAEQLRVEDAAFSVRAREVTAVVLNPGRSSSVSLHTGELDRPFEALDQCASKSLKDWGIDPAVQSTVAIRAHPATDAQSLFTSGDYPRAALQSFKEDNLDVWLNIDAQGRITACRVISDFASPEINGAICGMIRRKESFIPARTRDGMNVPDFYIQSFVFKLG